MGVVRNASCHASHCRFDTKVDTQYSAVDMRHLGVDAPHPSARTTPQSVSPGVGPFFAKSCEDRWLRLECCRYPDTVITAAGMVDESAVMIAVVVAVRIMSGPASRRGK